MNGLPLSTPRLNNIPIWSLRVVVAALFIGAAGLKLTGEPMMVNEFQVIGFGQWFRVVTGLLELLGAILILVPATSLVGAILVLLVDIGAFVAQVAVLHGDVIHTFVIATLLVALIYCNAAGSRVTAVRRRSRKGATAQRSHADR